MNAYLIAYVDTKGIYSLKFITAKDSITALNKTIPQFKSLIDNLADTKQGINIDTIYAYLPTIGINTFTITELEHVEYDKMSRTQVITVYDSYNPGIYISVIKDKNQHTALYNLITEDYAIDPTYDLEMMYASRNMRSMAMFFTGITGRKIYTVCTLAQLVKESLK